MKEKMEKFNQRWKIETSETPGESFQKFRIRVLNILKDIDSLVSEGSVIEFCQYYGVLVEWKYDSLGHNKHGVNILNKLLSEQNEVEFYRLIEIIFSLDIPGLYGRGDLPVFTKNTVYRDVCQAIEFSNINLTTTKNKDGEIIFYSRGEDFLDQNLVNKILGFLDEKSNAHFVDALNFYSEKEWVKSAESLRRSLEEFLRIKLKNNSGLKANIEESSKKLKAKNSPSQARNIIFQIFSYADQYFNDHSKHQDGDLKENEAEFLIYQIALLMRYINKQIL